MKNNIVAIASGLLVVACGDSVESKSDGGETAAYSYNGKPASVEGCKASERMIDDCRQEFPALTRWKEDDLERQYALCESDEENEVFGAEMLTYRDRWAYYVECQFKHPDDFCEAFIADTSWSVAGNSFQSCIWRSEEQFCIDDPTVNPCPHDCVEMDGEYYCDTRPL